MSQLKNLLGDSVIYGVGNFLLRATQIFILPLILFYLTKEEFGTLDYFLNIKNILVIVFGWGILTSIFKYSDPLMQNDSAPFNGFIVILTISLITLGLFFILSFFIEEIRVYWLNILFVQIISIFGAFLTIPLAIYRQKRKPINYIALNFTHVAIFLGVSFYLVLESNENYRSILWGHVIAATVSCLIGFLGIRKYISFKFSLRQFKAMFNFGFSILINSLSFVLILGSTRFFLKMGGTFEDVGILGMAQRLSLFVGALLISPFTLAWLPFVKANAHKSNFVELVNRVFSLFLWVGLFFCLILELFIGDLFFMIDNKEYLPAINYVLPFSLSYLFQGLYFIFSAGIFLSGDTRKYTIVGLSGIAVNLALYGLFFQAISMETVTFITLISFILVTVLAYRFGNKEMQIQVFSVKNVSIAIIYVILLSLATIVRKDSGLNISILAAKIATILLLFIGHLYFEKKPALKWQS